MNPTDALSKDYGMYYNGCWMRHEKLGVGRVMVDGSKMYLEYVKGKSSHVIVKPSMLSCWWPRAGAFNRGRNAVYIARRAIRNMRKSAVCGDHYFSKWGSAMNVEVMKLLRDGPNPMEVNAAIKAMRERKRTSAAISRDIIIHPEDIDKPKDPRYVVVFRGIEVGYLIDGCFEASFSENPLTGRVLRQLEEVL